MTQHQLGFVAHTGGRDCGVFRTCTCGAPRVRLDHGGTMTPLALILHEYRQHVREARRREGTW